jgi:hypothetical protein
VAEVLIATDGGVFGAGAPEPVALAGQPTAALALAAEGWWALADRRALWRAAAARPPAAVAELPGPDGTCLLAVDGQALVGTDQAHLVRVADGTVEAVAGFDQAEGREAWYTPWGGPPATRTLAAGPDGTLWANVHVGGILRSTDGGATWAPTIDIHADVHQVAVAPDRADTVLAACARGLASSGDGGRTWTYASDGLHASYCRAVAAAGDRLYLSAATGPGGRRAGLYRRPLAGGVFERCRAGLPEWFDANIDSGCLAAVGDEVAFGTAAGQVWRSSDAGGRWELAVSGLPPVRALVMR